MLMQASQAIRSLKKEYRSQQTDGMFAENQIAAITQKYLKNVDLQALEKRDDSPDATESNKEGQDLIRIAKLGYDVNFLLKNTDRDIRRTLYEASRVVDDGSFHKELQPGVVTELELMYGVPVVCKVNLHGQTPPLQLKVRYRSKGDLQMYASYFDTHPGPNCSKNDRHIAKPFKEKFGLEKGNKTFKQPLLYLSFVSEMGVQIQLNVQFLTVNQAEAEQ